MRYSHQRELILREVLGRKDHPTAEQICSSLRAECPRLSLGTVYRDLNTLVEIGRIRRVSIPGQADRFDGDGAASATRLKACIWTRPACRLLSMPVRGSKPRITRSPCLACAAGAPRKKRRAERFLGSMGK